MGDKAFNSTNLHTAVLHTTGIEVIPVGSPDLTPLTGTTTQFPADNQVRENLIHNLSSMANVSVETMSYHGTTRQTLHSPSENSRDSPVGGPDIPDQFNSEYRARQNISMYTANVHRLLLLCGDIESNLGPTDRDGDPLTQNQQTDGVSVNICKFISA